MCAGPLFLLSLSLSLYRSIVKQDMQDSMAMWPLTCYGFKQQIRYLPDLVDISPEELRLEAYKANCSGSLNDYLKNVDRLVKQQRDVRTKYCSIMEADLGQLVSSVFNASEQYILPLHSSLFPGQRGFWYVWWTWLV